MKKFDRNPGWKGMAGASGRWTPLRTAVLACLVGLALGADAAEESPLAVEASQVTASSPDAPVRVGDLVGRAPEAREALQALRRRVDRQTGLESIARDLDEVAEPWEAESGHTLESLRHETSASLVSEIGRVWLARSDRLRSWAALLRKRVSVLTDELEYLDEELALWEQARDEERQERRLPVLEETIGAVLTGIGDTRSHVRERLDAVLALQQRVSTTQRQVTEVLGAVDEAHERVRSQLLVRESPPLWSARSQAPEVALQRLQLDWKASVLALELYLKEKRNDVVVYLLSLAALVVGISLLARSVARSPEAQNEMGLSARALRRPLSAALLVLVLAYPLIIPKAPLLLRWLAAAVLLLPALRLVGPMLDGPARRALYWLIGLYAVDLLRLLMSSTPVLERILIVVEASAGAAFAIWMVRRGRLTAAEVDAARVRQLAVSARVVLVLLVVSLLSNLVGNVSLAELILVGTLRGAFLAVLLQCSALFLDDLGELLLRTHALQSVRGLQRHGALVRRRGRRFVRWLLGLVWLWMTLGSFQLRGLVGDALVMLSNATWPLGEVALSLGDLLAFGLTVWLAIWLSRFVRFVLDEDVLPRSDLPRGVPYAISAGIRYLILLFGFLLAAAAAGFDMSRLALIIGALGVGIGIGLQDVVNNFVSGLILLFERPVKPGDAVQVGDILGEVRRIGIRSSTVRTWNGAEVIVPNSKLASENVINWTLSDTLRRVEVPIGVAYGTDPERVIALLLEVARSHPAILDDPMPAALFQAHGESSLDFELRAWTASTDWVTVRSELTLAIHRALRAAGISIPFPQRDVHVHSADPKVGHGLEKAASES